jgi:hypothetical protein
VTTDYLLNRADVTNAPFNDEELTLIYSYRSLDERGKESIKNNLAFEMSHTVKKSAI